MLSKEKVPSSSFYFWKLRRVDWEEIILSSIFKEGPSRFFFCSENPITDFIVRAFLGPLLQEKYFPLASPHVVVGSDLTLSFWQERNTPLLFSSSLPLMAFHIQEASKSFFSYLEKEPVRKEESPSYFFSSSGDFRPLKNYPTFSFRGPYTKNSKELLECYSFFWKFFRLVPLNSKEEFQRNNFLSTLSYEESFLWIQRLSSFALEKQKEEMPFLRQEIESFGNLIFFFKKNENRQLSKIFLSYLYKKNWEELEEVMRFFCFYLKKNHPEKKELLRMFITSLSLVREKDQVRLAKNFFSLKNSEIFFS